MAFVALLDDSQNLTGDGFQIGVGGPIGKGKAREIACQPVRVDRTTSASQPVSPAQAGKAGVPTTAGAGFADASGADLSGVFAEVVGFTVYLFQRALHFRGKRLVAMGAAHLPMRVQIAPGQAAARTGLLLTGCCVLHRL